MKNKSYKMMVKEYEEKYGDIPLEQNKIISYLYDKLKFTNKDFEKLNDEINHVNNLEWRELDIVLPIIPKPSPRPRYSSFTKSFYVTGASENKKLLTYYIENIYSIIYTQTYFHVTTFLPTPTSSMSKVEIVRAEMGNLSAMSNPDWDNLGKTYSDMVQQILLMNDNIITKGNVEKYYSIKPRVVINIKYQVGFDSKFNKRRIINSTNFKKAIEIGNIIEVYTEGDDLF